MWEEIGAVLKSKIPVFLNISKANENVYTVVQPDLCVICDKSKNDKRGGIGAPDLIVEILLPENSKKEMKTK